jgi:4-diphosphocytidyl-2-C-methyl-D-erythritol kinase
LIINGKAYAKINWSLDILATRDDGYHDLNMLMQRIELHDDISFQNARWLSLSINGRQVPANGKNLVLKAANALSELMGKRYGARINLKKRIPVRAGLGGGSADCAVALIALNRLWGINLARGPLMEMGAKLGADVPFCMEGAFARVQGVGDRMDMLPGAPRIPLVLLMPSEGLSTAAVFGEYDAEPRSPLGVDMLGLARALRARDFAACREISGNSLEAPAIKLLPEVKNSIDRLYENGAAFARMTGSGSCVFGAFRTAAEALQAIERMGAGTFTWSMGDI